jgi:hypothetical protein
MFDTTKEFQRPIFDKSPLYTEVYELGGTFATFVGVNLGLIISTLVVRKSCNKCCKEDRTEDDKDY